MYELKWVSTQMTKNQPFNNLHVCSNFFHFMVDDLIQILARIQVPCNSVCLMPR